MNATERAANAGRVRETISTLWIVVVLNVAFADILGFLHPGTLRQIMTGDVGFELTQGLLLVFSILLEIPIAMIVLSRVLEPKLNRWANILAAIVTALFVIGGGSSTLSYMFFAAIEIACMLLIVSYAWKLPANDA